MPLGFGWAGLRLKPPTHYRPEAFAWRHGKGQTKTGCRLAKAWRDSEHSDANTGSGIFKVLIFCACRHFASLANHRLETPDLFIRIMPDNMAA